MIAPHLHLRTEKMFQRRDKAGALHAHA